jgi:hypothetical protein
MAINTGCYGSTDEAESRATLERAVELGVTLLDTANLDRLAPLREIVGPSRRGLIDPRRPCMVPVGDLRFAQFRLAAGHPG